MAISITRTPEAFDLFGVNPRYVEATSSEAGAKLKLTMFEKRGGSYEEVIDLEAKAKDGVFQWNISQFIYFADALPSTSAINTFVPYNAEGVIVEYKIEIRELLSDNTLNDTEVWEGVAIQGGVNEVDARDYSFDSSVVNLRRWLTNQPLNKLITKDQPEFLCFLNSHSGDVELKINILKVFQDGTSSETEVNVVAVQKAEVYYIPTGFKNGEVAQFGTQANQIIKYFLKVAVHEPGGGKLWDQPLVIYDIDYDIQSWSKRYFVFQNSLGGIDTLCSRGKAKVENDERRTYVTPSTRPGDPAWQHTERTSHIRSTVKVDQSIGYTDQKQRIWLQDLAMSRRVWQINVPGRKYMPITVTGMESPINEDDQGLQSSSFKYRESAKSAL